MKRLTFLIILCIAFANSSLAQHYFSHNGHNYSSRDSRPFRGSFNDYFGLRIGLSGSSLHTNALALYLPDIKGQSGLSIGAVYGINFTNEAPAFFEIGLKYTEKGAKSSEWQTDIKNPSRETIERRYTYYYNLNYIEMPFVFKYKHQISDEMSVQPFLGGYAALGIMGKSSLDKSFSEQHFKSIDGGIRLGCGLAVTKVYFELAFDIGLSNISQVGEYNSYAKNNSLELNVGLDF